jgi:epsin
MGSRSGGFGGSGNKYGGFGSDQVRSGGFGSQNRDSYDHPSYNHHDSSPDRTSYNHHDSTRVEPPQYAQLAEQPKTEPKPKAQEANLLDFDDDFTDFSAAPAVTTATNSNNMFNEFVTAPVTQPHTHFQSMGATHVSLSSTSPVFATFGSPPVQAPKAPATSMQSFANFGAQPPVAIQNNVSQPSFANFGQFPSPAQPAGPLSQQSPSAKAPVIDDFGDFQASSTPSDPISKLVSLDAFSLGSNAKKENVGPSLHSLATPKTAFQMK